MIDQLSLLNYYIPAGAKVASPCPVLYPRAIHLDGSNWIIKSSLIPWNTMNNIVEAGGRFWTYKFDASEQQNLMRDAIGSIQNEIAQAKIRLNKSLEGIEAKDAEDGEICGWKERQKRANDRRGAVKRLTELLKKLELASREYGINVQGGIQSARKLASDLTHANFSRAALVADLAQQAQHCGGEGAAGMAQAARLDEVPVAILADYVEVHGGNADAVRQIVLNQGEVNGNGHLPAMMSVAEEEVETEEPVNLMRTDIVATYARLEDRSWGVRTTSANLAVGFVVTGRRSTGQTQLVRLTRMSRHFRKDGVTLWEFEGFSEPVKPEQKEEESILPDANESPVKVPKPEKVSSLLTKGAWWVSYEVEGDRAVVKRGFGAQTEEEFRRTRKEAQDHYAGSLAQGYKVPGKKTEDF